MKKILLISGLLIGLIQLSMPISAEELCSKKVSESDKAEMILIPEGNFIYGIDQNELRKVIKKDMQEIWANIYNDESKKETRNLKSFCIDRYEVTNEKYDAFVRATSHQEPQYRKSPQLGGLKQPVVGVGWKDAEAYCKWSGKQLPMEEQWEKAARGTDGRIWPWGNEKKEVFNGKKQKNFKPMPVGRYPEGKSPYGVEDMAGNVWEMTATIDNNDSNVHIMRGGSFLNSLGMVRTTVRWSPDEDGEKDGADWLGFRCVENIPTR